MKIPLRVLTVVPSKFLGLGLRPKPLRLGVYGVGTQPFRTTKGFRGRDAARRLIRLRTLGALSAEVGGSWGSERPTPPLASRVARPGRHP